MFYSMFDIILFHIYLVNRFYDEISKILTIIKLHKINARKIERALILCNITY